MRSRDFDGQSRIELIARAEALGVEKASLLTRSELADEIVRRTISDPVERRIARGLLGLARDLVARVVERGLHLPEAAAKIRAIPVHAQTPFGKPPIATVTLAEIYAAQGHRAKALHVLEEVLANEPDHAAARQLYDTIAASSRDIHAANAGPNKVSRSEAPPEPTPASPATVQDEAAAPVHDDTTPVQDVAVAPVHDDTTPVQNEAAPVQNEAAISSHEWSGHGAKGPEDGRTDGHLDDEPLPASYDADEVVLMPVDPTTLFAYWEIRERTLQQAREARPAGRLVLRIVAVSANWRGPIVETRDLETDRAVGEWFVRDLPVGAVLRAAIGWRAAPGFEPLSVAMETTSLPAAPSSADAQQLGVSGSEGLAAMSMENDAMETARQRGYERVARAAASQGSSSWVALPAARQLALQAADGVG